MRKISAIVALTAIAFSNSLNAAENAKSCLSPAEASTVIGYFLPPLLEAARNSCTPKLSPGSFLATNGEALVQKYTNSRPTDTKEIAAIMAKIDLPDLPQGMAQNPELLASMIGVLAQAGLADELKAEDCALADKVLTDLAPLPPSNMASLLTTLASALSAHKTMDGKSETAGKHSDALAGMMCARQG